MCIVLGIKFHFIMAFLPAALLNRRWYGTSKYKQINYGLAAPSEIFTWLTKAAGTAQSCALFVFFKMLCFIYLFVFIWHINHLCYLSHLERLDVSQKKSSMCTAPASLRYDTHGLWDQKQDMVWSSL